MAGFVFESINQERIFEVDATNFVTHERISKGKKIESAYWKCSEMYMQDGPDTEYRVQGVYLNDLTGVRDALTDESAAIAVEDRYITVPSFQVKDVQKILESDAAINAVRDGHLAVTIEEYTNKFGTNYKLVWHTV